MRGAPHDFRHVFAFIHERCFVGSSIAATMPNHKRQNGHPWPDFSQKPLRAGFTRRVHFIQLGFGHPNEAAARTAARRSQGN
jgi:hypothetical protein